MNITFCISIITNRMFVINSFVNCRSFHHDSLPTLALIYKQHLHQKPNPQLYWHEPQSIKDPSHLAPSILLYHQHLPKYILYSDVHLLMFRQYRLFLPFLSLHIICKYMYVFVLVNYIVHIYTVYSPFSCKTTLTQSSIDKTPSSFN